MLHDFPSILAFVGHELGAPLLHSYSMTPSAALKNDIISLSFNIGEIGGVQAIKADFFPQVHRRNGSLPGGNGQCPARRTFLANFNIAQVPSLGTHNIAYFT